VGQRRQVVLRQEMLESLNIQEGDFVALAEQKNGVLIKPGRVVEPDDVLTPEGSALVKKPNARCGRENSLRSPNFAMTWIVHIHKGAARQLEALPPDRRQRVLDDIAAFEEDPFRGLVKPLKGRDRKPLPQGVGSVSH